MKIKYVKQIKGHNHVCYVVKYFSGREYCYYENDNLPDTVVEFIFNANDSTTSFNPYNNQTFTRWTM